MAALLNIFQRKMWCWTFSFGKCDAEHFTLENVMLNIFLWKMYASKMHFGIKCIFASNAFLHSWTFSFGKCTPKCILASNAFLHSWTFSFGKCDAKMHFCTAEHFPLENVRQNAFWHQMHFGIKCICNILFYKMWCKNAFDAKMHFCNAQHQMHL